MSEVNTEWQLPSQALQASQIPDFAINETRTQREDKRYGFRCAGLNFLIAARTYSELAHARDIAALPGSPRHLLGLYNLRGNLLPVFNLALAMGGEKNTLNPNYLLILDQREQALALAIEQQPETVSQLKLLSGQHALPENLLPHVSQIWLGNKQVWLEFEHRSFFRSLSQQSYS